MHEGWRRSINDIAAIVEVSYGNVQAILTSDLNMHHIAAKFGPRLLIPDQKEFHAAICQDLHQNGLHDPIFTSMVFSGDETWVYGYDLETKQQSSKWKIPKSPTKEGETSLQRAHEHAYRFIRHLQNCSLRINPRRQDRQREVLLQCTEASEEGHSAEMT